MGMNPMQFLQRMYGSNPMYKRAQEMAQGKGQDELLKTAQNICQQKGLDINRAFEMFQNSMTNGR